MTKRLSDITFEIQNQSKKKTKIVHFDRLKKATLTPVKLHQSDNEKLPENSTDSDSDFEQVAPRTRKVKDHVAEAVAEPNLVDAQEPRLVSPELPQHLAVAPQSPDRNAAEIPKAMAVPATIPKAAVKAPAAPDLVVVTKHYAAGGAPAAPAEKAEPRRVSVRTNKGHAPRRYSPSASSNVTINTVLLSLFFILLLAAAAGA